MFWSDVTTRAIYRAREDGSEFTILISTNITTPGIIMYSSKQLHNNKTY